VQPEAARRRRSGATARRWPRSARPPNSSAPTCKRSRPVR